MLLQKQMLSHRVGNSGHVNIAPNDSAVFILEAEKNESLVQQFKCLQTRHTCHCSIACSFHFLFLTLSRIWSTWLISVCSYQKRFSKWLFWSSTRFSMLRKEFSFSLFSEASKKKKSRIQHAVPCLAMFTMEDVKFILSSVLRGLALWPQQPGSQSPVWLLNVTILGNVFFQCILKFFLLPVVHAGHVLAAALLILFH